MPTGYTADVQDGKVTEIGDFIRLCSRAFIFHLRPEIPKFTEWARNHTDHLVRDVMYHEEKSVERGERRAKTNAWITALLESIPE
jgi:hypothetical protein